MPPRGRPTLVVPECRLSHRRPLLLREISTHKISGFVTYTFDTAAAAVPLNAAADISACLFTTYSFTASTNSFFLSVPVLVPVRASPVPSVVRGSTWSTWSFVVKFLAPRPWACGYQPHTHSKCSKIDVRFFIRHDKGQIQRGWTSPSAEAAPTRLEIGERVRGRAAPRPSNPATQDPFSFLRVP